MARNWGLIADGATFEGLAVTLVFFQDAKARLFGRRGKDGGQDARSGDGLTVFQAKHHEQPTAAVAIADAKREAQKIADYRQPGHVRFYEWQPVQHWRLVTNAQFNPTDDQRWKDEVEPLFAGLSLSASYWSRRTLDALLTEHPSLDAEFFEGETRAFLTLPEAEERQRSEAPAMPRATRASLQGRADELAVGREFLSSDGLFLVVAGPGGVGKTRMLVEIGATAANEGWQVLWANVAAMDATGWYRSIVPERATLVLVDEPSAALLHRLEAQIGLGRTSKWKVAVAVRSFRDPALQYLRSPRVQSRCRDLVLGPMSEAAASAFCAELLGTGPLAGASDAMMARAVKMLSGLYDRYPIWMALAVDVVERRGALGRVPEDERSLAEEYVSQVISEQTDLPRPDLLALMRWLALCGELNSENTTLLDVVATRAGISDRTTTLGHLSRLVERGVAIQRGARGRIFQIKPDVIRDQLLRSWLVTKVGTAPARWQPSGEAQRLVAEVVAGVLAGGSDETRRLLSALARVEWLQRLAEQPLPILDGLFLALRDATPTLNAQQRITVTKEIAPIGRLHPSEVTALSAQLRGTYCEPVVRENRYHTGRSLGVDDVVANLAPMLLQAAMGARSDDERQEVFREACALVEAEADIASRCPLADNGARASTVLREIVHGSPHFWGDFDAETRACGLSLLDELARASMPNAPRLKLVEVLIQAATTCQRTYDEGDDAKIVMHQYQIRPGHPAWSTSRILIDHARVDESCSKPRWGRDALETIHQGMARTAFVRVERRPGDPSG